MSSFKTEISGRDVSIYDLDIPQVAGLANGDDYEIYPNTFVVSWNFEIEERSWGVKGLSWYVTNIEGSFEIEFTDESKIAETIEFDFAPFKDNTDMSDMDIADGCPSSLDIYYNDKSISLA